MTYFKRVYSVVVPSDDPQPGHSQGLGGVSLGEDEGAARAVLGSCLVSILQLGNASQLVGLLPRLLGLQLCISLELGPQ